MVSKGNHPQMAELFRLVKYYNLPIYIYICMEAHLYILVVLYIYIYRYMYYWFCRTPILIASDDIIPKEKKMGEALVFSCPYQFGIKTFVFFPGKLIRPLQFMVNDS